MNQAPAISIITPVWNGMPFIIECVESVLAQDFDDWELLISDNGSADGTRDYLGTLNDPRIRIFYQKKNLGIIGNVNFLFSKVRASISQILCADDYFTGPGSLSSIVRYWQAAPAGLGFVRFNHMEPSTCLSFDFQKEIAPPVLSAEEAGLWFFVFGNIPGNLSNVSLRTSLVAGTGWFNPDFPFAGDFEFWSRAARKVAMGIENEMVIYVRRHENTASNYLSLKGELYPQHIAIYERLIDELSPFFNRRKLINFFNFEVCSFHYRNGIKAALHGNFAYLKRFLTTRSPILWPKWFSLPACLVPALYEKGRMRVTVRMIRNFLHQSHKAPAIRITVQSYS